MPPLRAPTLLVVTRRELIRHGRRWQTWALRLAFTSMLLALIGVMWADRIPEMEAIDRVALGATGTMIFGFFVGVQTVALVALTPILVANAVIEERQGGTLQLLALTRLGPARILWGKVLSRVVALELVVLGGLPLLALCSSLGGLGPYDLLNVFVQSTTMILSLAAVACFLSLYADGPFRPALQTWFWTIGAWWMGTLPHGLLQLDHHAFASISPSLALFGARGWQILGPPIAQLPVSVAVLVFAAAGLRAMLSGADDASAGFGSLSQEFAGLRRVKRSLAWTAAAIVGLLPIVIFQKPLGGFFAPLGQLSLPWTSLWIWLGTGLYLLGLRALLLRREAKARKTPLKSWTQLSQEWDAAGRGAWSPLSGTGGPQGPSGRAAPTSVGSPRSAPRPSSGEASAWDLDPGPPSLLDAHPPRAVAAQVAGLSGGPRRSPEKVTRSRRWFFARQVWSDPVVWRETVTAAWGGLGQSLWRLYLGFGTVCVLLLLLGAFKRPETSLTVSICAMAFALLATLLSSTASVASELRSGTLSLLLTSRLSPARVLRSKVLATAVFAGPAWTVAVLLALQGGAQFSGNSRLNDHWSRFASWLGLSAWTLAVLLALTITCHAVGLRARTSSRAWIGAVLWAGWNIVGSGVARALVDGSRTGERLVGLWVPMLEQDAWFRGSATWLWPASTLLWLALAAFVFWRNVRYLQRG